MDHKRGHGASDHMHESTRIKRHKDLSYQQPSNALATTFSIFSPQPVAHRHTSADFDQRDKVQLASLERLRAIADNSAQCVDKLCGCSLQSNIEKSVEEVIYEEYLPVVLSQLAARSDQSSTLPLLLTDKNAEIQCAICPDEKRFKGWEALLLHAAKFQKGNNHQHRGYYRAIREALSQTTEEKLPLADIDEAPTSPNYKHSKGREQQPVILLDKQPETKSGRTSRDPQLQEVLAVYSTGHHKKKKVVVIPASKVSYISNAMLKEQSTSPLSNKPEDCARVKFMEGRWPGAIMSKYVGCDQLKENRYPHEVSSNYLAQAIELGRPRSPKEKSYQTLAENERAIHLKDELRLNKPLEEHRHIFDEHQFDTKVNAMVTRWKNNFKGFEQDRIPPIISLEPNHKYVTKRGPLKSLQKDEDFKDEVDQYALLNPSCRKQVKKQLSVLEEQLRKDRLIWLQEVETVRQQFQHMADAVHDEQVERDAATMRIEKHMEKRMRTFDEHQLMRKEYFMTRKVINLHNCKRLRREVEMKHLMDLWREEQQDFERESKYARSVKEKLESTHMKSHFKDHLSQQGEQLKKGQQWSSDEDTVVGRQMFHHNFN